jgi:phosphatidylserine/phosphatidylglycerophosphate/cardiolipin synthase-like enzyme
MKPKNTFFKWIIIPIIFSLLLSSVLVSPSVSAQDEQPPTPTEIPIEEEPVIDDFPEPTPQPTLEEGESEGGEVEGFQSFSVQTVTTPSPADRDCSDGRCVFIVSSSSDDAGLHPNCTYSTTANEIYMGQCTNGQPITSGFRFQNVNLPPGTVIQNAYLEFTLDGPYTDELNVVFYGQNSGNASTFTNTSRPSNRPLTIASVPWHISVDEPWSLDQIGMPPSPPSITPIIQEIINRPDWVQGNAIVIILRNVGPSSGTFKHRRVIAYDRFTSTYGATNAARLVIELEYDCSDYENTLSDIGQVVLGVVGEQNYCLNKFENLTFIKNASTGQAAFQEFADLASEAKYEVDFTTMIWEQAPGEIFLSGVKELHEKVKLNPDNYPYGVRIRILLGLEQHILFDQRLTVLNSLSRLDIPSYDLAGKWLIEVASYRDSQNNPFLISPNTHSHVKFFVVDGQTAIVSGYNFQNSYLNSTIPDVGITISGPIVQNSLEMFDQLWHNGRCLALTVCDTTTQPVEHAPEVQLIQTDHSNPINIFSLFRDATIKTADNAIIQAIGSSNLNVNLLQNRYFENYPPTPYCPRGGECIDRWVPNSDPSGDNGPFSYTQAIVNALQNGAQVQILLSSDFYSKDKNIDSIENLQSKLDDSIKHNLFVKFFDGLLHAKSISLDGEFVIVGSQNFDWSAFDGANTDDPMDLSEYSFGVDSEDVANQFDAEFEALWGTGKDYIPVVDSIQETIAQAPAGAIVYIPAGVYREVLTIDKPLTLIGDISGGTILETPSGSQNIIEATSSEIELSHLTLRHGEYGIALIDVSPSSLRDVRVNNIVFEDNTLGGILVEGLISGSPIQYTIENNTFVGAESGITLNLLETQQNISIVRNNIFIGQSVAPIRILSAEDGGVNYAYNLFSLCGSSLDCSTTWFTGNLSAISEEANNLFNIDPLFLDPAFSDYRLSPNSPAIDAGDPSILNSGEYNGGSFRIDIGAFESFLTLEDLSAFITDDVPNVPGFVTETSQNKTNLRYYINPEGDEDWFRFRLTETGNIQVHLTSLPANYDLYVYNAAGQLIDSSTKEKKAAELVKIDNASSGYYYVRVVGVNGAWSANNAYQLRFNTP